MCLRMLVAAKSSIPAVYSVSERPVSDSQDSWMSCLNVVGDWGNKITFFYDLLYDNNTVGDSLPTHIKKHLCYCYDNVTACEHKGNSVFI